MVWSDWLTSPAVSGLPVVPPPPPRPRPTVPPLGQDEEEEFPGTAKPKNIPVKASRKDRSNEFIDVYIIEEILKEDNGLELKWLQELLEDDVRVLNHTGRYIKSGPFLEKVKRQTKRASH